MMKTMLASAAAVALTAGMAVADYTLTVLHTNDFHARLSRYQNMTAVAVRKITQKENALVAQPDWSQPSQKPAQGPKIQFWWMAEINFKAPYFIPTIRGNWPLR